MISMGRSMAMFKKAKVTPTANASILVAIDRISNSLKEKTLQTSSSADKDSYIIFKPIPSNNRNAIQGAKVETIYWSCIPESHPKTGMKAWNTPKDRAMINAYFMLHFKVKPRVTETLKASMARPMAKKIIEMISILKTLKPVVVIS